MVGLEYAIGLLKSDSQNLIEYRFKNGKSYQEISKVIGYAATTASKMCGKAVEQLKKPEFSVWITEGFNGHISEKNKLVEQLKERFISEGKLKQAKYLDQTPDILSGISKSQANMFFMAGYPAIGNIVELIESDAFWFERISGIGYEKSKKIIDIFVKNGLLEKNIEAYKLATDKKYYFDRLKSKLESGSIANKNRY